MLFSFGAMCCVVRACFDAFLYVILFRPQGLYVILFRPQGYVRRRRSYVEEKKLQKRSSELIRGRTMRFSVLCHPKREFFNPHLTREQTKIDLSLDKVDTTHQSAYGVYHRDH